MGPVDPMSEVLKLCVRRRILSRREPRYGTQRQLSALLRPRPESHGSHVALIPEITEHPQELVPRVSMTASRTSQLRSYTLLGMTETTCPSRWPVNLLFFASFFAFRNHPLCLAVHPTAADFPGGPVVISESTSTSVYYASLGVIGI